MGIKFKRDHNICERCKKDVSEVGKTTFFEEYDLVLCTKCAEETIKEENFKCPKCKKVVGTVKMTEYNDKPMCYECKEKALVKEKKTRERIRFFRKYWYIWFGAFIAIIIAILT